ncbi:TonB-dependent receptor [Campylobacter ureolyticus]|uniref:TonB-dependent receptor domain-containing protein n=1 Tax=Campylobacter ureolyticus TaxID=827 RepID=UPI00215B30B4|nr:TonB-dependent receptor [Campylobacter ureolyticus]MCR8698889.1 TonB-dependent receptor [Campylobacter ureolyticus]
MKSLTRLSLIAVCFGCLNAAETITLDTIDVEDKELKADKEVYQKAKAVSAREDIATSTQNLDTILRSIPGTFTNQDKSTGTIAPNIRGSQGFGRVNTMIDGVTQTFYSSGADDGRSGSTSQFGATIDPSFIAGVDVERGTFGGKSGVNSLMGSANFRTLGVNDIIKGDKNFGFLGKYQVGDNAYKSNYMGTFAGRAYYDDGFYVGALIGHSHRDISQDYKVGGGIKINDINKIEFENLHKKFMDFGLKIYKPSAKKGGPVYGKDGKRLYEYTTKRIYLYPEDIDEGNIVKDSNGNYYAPKGNYNSPICQVWDDQTKCVNIKDRVPVLGDGPKDEYLKEREEQWKETSQQYDQTPYDPNKLKQEINSYITKFEFGDERNLLTLSFRNLENKIWSRKIEANNYQLNYNLNNDKNIDLNVLFAYNETKQKYNDMTQISGKQLIADLETKNKSTTFDISNTFKSDFSDTTFLTTTIGLNNLKNSYSKNRHPYELVWFNDYRQILDGKANNYPNMTPEKRQKLLKEMLNGGFLTAPSNMGAYGGVYDFSSLDTPSIHGYRANTFQPSGKQEFFTIYADNSLDFGIFNLNVGTNLVKYNYNGKYFDLVDKKRGYGEYNGKPNEIMFDDYGKRKAFNYSATLSAFVDELFTPFVSYSKSSRFPTLQEMYFTQRTSNGFANDLDNEYAKTWQIGLNSFKENLIFDKDIFGFKALYYHTKIDNYIHNVLIPRYNIQGYNKHSNRLDPKYKLYNNDDPYIKFVNYDKDVVKKGFEMEISYDMGLFYINLAYARQTTNQPTSASDASPAIYPAPTRNDFYSLGHGISKVTMLPKDYGSLDTGVRLMNEKLTIGTRVKYFGESKRAIYESNTFENKPLHRPECTDSTKCGNEQKYIRWTEVIEKQPFIFDFYVSYEPIENLVIKAEVQNAFDKQYIDPLDTNNDAASMRSYSFLNGENNSLSNFAKGRTAVLSFEYRY